MEITAYGLAERFIGTQEIEGRFHNPRIMAMLTLDNEWPTSDETPWCSAFVNEICWLLRLPRSKSLLARSWLNVGVPVLLDEAVPGFDVVILNRGNAPQDASNTTAPGHVGFFTRYIPDALASNRIQQGRIWILGGNQNDSVNVSQYDAKRVLGVRRLLV